MTVGFVLRCLIVTIAAAVVTWLPMAFLLTVDMDVNLALFFALKLFLLSIAGCALIGLPVALLLVWRLDRPSLPQLLLWANGCAMVLIFFSFVFAQGFGVLFLGLPCVLAANAFALFGWFIIVPARNSP